LNPISISRRQKGKGTGNEREKKDLPVLGQWKGREKENLEGGASRRGERPPVPLSKREKGRRKKALSSTCMRENREFQSGKKGKEENILFTSRKEDRLPLLEKFHRKEKKRRFLFTRMGKEKRGDLLMGSIMKGGATDGERKSHRKKGGGRVHLESETYLEERKKRRYLLYSEGIGKREGSIFTSEAAGRRAH